MTDSQFTVAFTVLERNALRRLRLRYKEKRAPRVLQNDKESAFLFCRFFVCFLARFRFGIGFEAKIFFPPVADFAESSPIVHLDSVHAFKHLKVNFGLYLL